MASLKKNAEEKGKIAKFHQGHNHDLTTPHKK